jgi:phosphate:Na+ symporter
MDNVVDKLDEAIKLYVTKLTCGSLDEREGRRAMEIISFSINLEHVGDIIDKNLTELAAKKIKRKLQFSDEGAHERAAFHDRIVRSFRMALAVFMSGDASDAHRLIGEKVKLRSAELAAAERRLERLRAGQPETLETTSLHLDVLRDLKRIHSHICDTGEFSGWRKPDCQRAKARPAINRSVDAPNLIATIGSTGAVSLLNLNELGAV